MGTDKQNIFDFPEGMRRKEQGMAEAANPRMVALAAARSIACTVGMEDYYFGPDNGITADDVFNAVLEEDADPDLGKAWGSIWRGPFAKHWHPTGESRKSRRTTNHCRPQAVWKWRP